MYTKYTLWEMNEAHRAELLKVADKQRSLAKAQKLSPKWQTRALEYMGDILITVGSRLKAHNTFVTRKFA